MKYLIAGLGNIGPEYANTRHNLGFMVLDKLAGTAGLVFDSKRYAWKTEFRFKGRTFILIKPTTFMNLSGKAVSYWLKKENIPDENLLVIADDIALPIGTLRLRKKGGAGGHNGITSIIEHLGTDEFSRLRIGAGNEFPVGYQVKFVLGDWSQDEMKILNPKLETAVEIIKSFGTIGVDLTMNAFNNK
jgi:peptidyl-tRNA hydrolase, PTH1 family